MLSDRCERRSRQEMESMFEDTTILPKSRTNSQILPMHFNKLKNISPYENNRIDKSTTHTKNNNHRLNNINESL